jgi:hypothetical protein
MGSHSHSKIQQVTALRLRNPADNLMDGLGRHARLW